jgi:hypothetical protein
MTCCAEKHQAIVRPLGDVAHADNWGCSTPQKRCTTVSTIDEYSPQGQLRQPDTSNNEFAQHQLNSAPSSP